MNTNILNILFKNVKDISYWENKYPKRNLKENQIVTRFAPSPTGFIHIGSLYTAYVSSLIAKQSKGIFYLRIEDTDQKRLVDNSINLIINDLKKFDITFDEGQTIGGKYGPYIQSERKEIYKSYVKHLYEKNLAYICFCNEDKVNEIRKKQIANKERIGYYKNVDPCLQLSESEILKKLNNKKDYCIRLKSPGNYLNKFKYNDAIKGEVNITENDLNIVLLKNDNLPTYHLAHVIDDHLMHSTHILRGDEWLSSLPIHLQLFKLFNFEIPIYGHLSPLTKKENETVRKLSKRKDPECKVSYYKKLGIPNDVIKIYLTTLSNTNFEEWYKENKNYNDFKLSFNNMPIGGTLFDIEKLKSISLDYFATLKAETIYDMLYEYTKEYDQINFERVKDNKDYLISILNIERNIERPRKDISSLSDILKNFWFMFDDLFNQKNNYEKSFICDKNIVLNYINNIYDENDSEEIWFEKLKEYAFINNFAKNKKVLANDSTKIGTVADFCEVLRVIITTSLNSPNIYYLMKLLKKDNILNRVEKFYKKNSNK